MYLEPKLKLEAASLLNTPHATGSCAIQARRAPLFGTTKCAWSSGHSPAMFRTSVSGGWSVWDFCSTFHSSLHIT
jgi:hypothetical protein